MVSCPTCGGGNYEEIAGLFYCSECNTQSQELRLEELDDFADVLTFGFRSGRTPTKRSLGKSERQEKDQYTHEILNKILLAQLKALENLGASPRLRRVVRKLWLTFLQRCQLAFLGRNPDEEKTPRLGVVNYQRDVLLTVQRSPQDSVRRALLTSGIRTRVRECKGKRSRLSRSLDKQDDVDINTDVEEDTELYSNVAGSFMSWEQYRAHLTSRNPTAPMRDSFLHLSKLLAFLFLGILIAREPVLLADLVRWSARGHLPYLRAWRQEGANFPYGTVPPRAPQVLVETARLARFLGMPERIECRPLQPLVARFLLDLNLPIELLKLCNWLQTTSRPLLPQHWVSRERLRATAFPAEELSAAALLLLVLKLTLGLDGSSERRLSLSADRVNEASDARVFSWNRWEEQEKAREALLLDYCCFSTLGDPRRVVRLPKVPVDWDLGNRQAAMRQELQSCIRGLHAGTGMMTTTMPPTSFPFSTRVVADDGRERREDFTCHRVLCFLGVPLENAPNLEEAPDDYWILHNGARHYSLLIEPSLPQSFVWVLQMAATLVGCRPAHLYQEVVRLEKIVFKGKKSSSGFKPVLPREAEYDRILCRFWERHGAGGDRDARDPEEGEGC